MSSGGGWEALGILTLLIVMLALIPIALALLSVIVLYIFDVTVFGYTPTIRQAFTALFILTLFDAGGSAKN